MNHTKDHKSGCCGGDKHYDSQPEKEKDSCCDNTDRKPETNKAEKQGGCCGSKN